MNADQYRRVRNALTQMGFQGRTWTTAEIQAVTGQTALPYIEEFTQNSYRAKIVVRMFFGMTGIGEPSRAFHYFLKDAFENAAVVIYDGHSGMGSNLNLAQIEAKENFFITLPMERYQMLYFNSCSSYPYYRASFFERKSSENDPNGTKNLDILTNGLETYFAVMGNGSYSVIRAIQSWAQGGQAPSYQQLASQIDSQNLFGVNGEEDNPSTMPR